MHENYDIEQLLELVENKQFRRLKELLSEMNEVDIAEFMDDDRLESLVMRCGEGVGVEYASPAVSVGVCEDYDMFIWDSGKLVMHIFQTQGCQVAVHIECVEMSL